MGDTTKITKSIRGLDPDLYNRARAEALKRGITIGQYVNEALALKLKQDRGKKQPKAKP
ncbi:hypothetical protein ES708_22238 [subsurface metagenome]